MELIDFHGYFMKISNKPVTNLMIRKCTIFGLAFLLTNTCIAENISTKILTPPPEINSDSHYQNKDERFTINTIRYDIPSERHSFHFTQDFSGAKVVGTGNYRYHLVLQDPIEDDKVKANTPYALSHHDIVLPFEPSEKNVYQATTDNLGRTDVFAFEKPVEPDRWDLRERAGAGQYGEQFYLKDQDGKPLPIIFYTLLLCGETPIAYQGYANRDGQTAYAATPNITPLAVSINLTEDDVKDVDNLKQICHSEIEK